MEFQISQESTKCLKLKRIKLFECESNRVCKHSQVMCKFSMLLSGYSFALQVIDHFLLFLLTNNTSLEVLVLPWLLLLGHQES